ncbi:MAG: metallophosphoesterase [Clostridia bacterium]|nr:metallophosphoesterase [Clostridia bacterium]
MKGKIFFKIIGIIVSVVVLFCAVTSLITVVGRNSNMKKIESFEQVKIENQLVPVEDENGYWTFTTDKDFKVVHLTDIHIGAGWLCHGKDLKAINAVAAMVTAEKPDLVIITGDIAYPIPFQAGTNDNLAAAKLFASLMEKLGVYWTVAFGNHDTEIYSKYNREEIAQFYENSGFRYCLFKSGPEDVDGYCNNIINIKNSKGEITQSIFTFDSHSYTEHDIFGIGWKYDNIHENQVEWYRDCVKKLTDYNKSVSDMKNPVPSSTAFFHIPLKEYQDAWYEYLNNDFKDTENVKLIHGVAGEGGIIVYPGDGEDTLFETMLELGSTKGIFCGHDHENNFCLDYKGIQLSYGMSVDYLAYIGISRRGAQRGCKVITYSPDGSFTSQNENYYQDKYISQFQKETVNMEELTQLAEIEE